MKTIIKSFENDKFKIELYEDSNGGGQKSLIWLYIELKCIYTKDRIIKNDFSFKAIETIEKYIKLFDRLVLKIKMMNCSNKRILPAISKIMDYSNCYHL